MATYYLVSAYYPGCLPDSEPHGSTDYSEACEMLADDLQFYLDHVSDSDRDAQDDVDRVQAAVSTAQSAGWSPVFLDNIHINDVGGMTYALEAVEHVHTYDRERSAWQCMTCDTALEDCVVQA